MMLDGKTPNIKKVFTIRTANQNNGGKGTLQERKENFLRKSIIIHNNKYNYSKSVYKNRDTKIEIICPIHNSFFQNPHNHMYGEGCPKCGELIRLSHRTSSTKEFICKAKRVYGNKYDYSKFFYIRSFVKGIIICPKHGEFLQTPNSHLCGVECPYCFGTPKKNTSTFINNAINLWSDTYDYSLVNYNGNKEKIIIICKKHGNFLQRPNDHLSGYGCPKCQSSKGELKILNFLKNHNIIYQYQKTFKDCRNPTTNQMLKFDFYIPSKNLLIEYDGEQHFKIGDFGSFKFTKQDLNDVRQRDKIKSHYAKLNNIKLLRIKYTKLNKIDTILSNKL